MDRKQDGKLEAEAIGNRNYLLFNRDRVSLWEDEKVL